MISSTILSLFFASTVPTAAAPAAAPLSPCSIAERHQLDFWIGDWDVFPAIAPTTLIAHSSVESIAGGCAIRETWKPLKGSGGGSISAYVPELKRWRQTWADSQGSWVELTGGMTGDGLTIEGSWAQPGKPQQVTRMTYRPLLDGAVQQYGETSDDGGSSWQPGFDFIYRPRSTTTGN